MTLTEIGTDFIYIYGVILTEELQYFEIPTFKGIDQKPFYTTPYKDLAAVITPVNALDYSQEQIDLLIKDAEWLKEKAFQHHEVIAAIHNNATVLPFSFCTIFQKETTLESFLSEQYDAFYQKLLSLKGKQEWNIKMFCDTDKALAHVIDHNPAVLELKENLAFMPKGKQFLMKKKLEHLIVNEFELEQAKWWQEINQKLLSFVHDTNLRKNWGKEVTERKDDMIMNADYLIETSKTEHFLNKIQEIEKTYTTFGCTLHVTGPWPPYHFSKMVKES
ncbi:GvpL/GvpF family gas vesicle protein [Neobacillus sp. NRS-1170]|uniref:GvpL/GvpF family gas vesicle protein n=1 Tax=Neobacillus sp. NRS-1170 TaxID=3233898 RepID=UPI003D28DB12